MDFDVQLVHSVGEVEQEAWDRLAGDRPFASYRWYRYGETVLADNTPIYIIISQGGEPVARGTFWLRGQEQLPVSSRVPRRLVEIALRRWPLLVCQTPLADASGLILPDSPLHNSALETIAQTAQDQAERHHASFLTFLYLAECEAKCAGWPNAFAAVQFPEPLTRLVIEWPDFESYLEHLSYSRRRNMKRHGKSAARLGIQTRHHPMVQPLDSVTLDEALVLIRNVERHHEASPFPWARSMLENAWMVDTTWLAAEIDNRLVGCGLVLGDGEHRVMKLLGLDYEVQYAYFQIFYAAVRSAIENRTKTLWGGSGAYELKRHLGFRVESKHYVVFAGRGPLQKVGDWMAQGIGNAEARAYEN